MNSTQARPAVERELGARLRSTARVAASEVRRVRLPLEWRVAAIFSAIWLIGIAVGLPVSLPVQADFNSLQYHFFGPVLLAALMQFVATVLSVHILPARTGRDPTTMIRMLPLVVMSVFFYFNFKAWMPFIHPRLYDAFYQRIDEAAAPLLHVLLETRQAVATAVPLDVDQWYMSLFLGMFFLSISVHGLLDPAYKQRQLIFGMCLNLLIGGVSYWVAPALGPFLYREGLNEIATANQAAMLNMYQHAVSSHTLPAGYFTAPLGAMPSLHVAHSLFFTLCAWRSARWLLVFYVPATCWLVIEASASSYHYLVDLPAGALLAVLSFWLARRVIPAPPAQPENKQA